MKKLSKVLLVISLLLFIAMTGWYYTEETKESKGREVDYQSELRNYYEEITRENGNTTPFKTEKINVNNKFCYWSDRT